MVRPTLLALVAALLVIASPASAAVVINEADSTPTDFVELYNTGPGSVDISGWVLKDNDDTHAFAIPAATTLAAGAYYNANALGFGLGQTDAARLFMPGGTTLVDSYEWTDDAAASYGRCPNGSGIY